MFFIFVDFHTLGFIPSFSYLISDVVLYFNRRHTNLLEYHQQERIKMQSTINAFDKFCKVSILTFFWSKVSP